MGFSSRNGFIVRRLSEGKMDILDRIMYQFFKMDYDGISPCPIEKFEAHFFEELENRWGQVELSQEEKKMAIEAFNSLNGRASEKSVFEKRLMEFPIFKKIEEQVREAEKASLNTIIDILNVPKDFGEIRIAYKNGVYEQWKMYLESSKPIDLSMEKLEVLLYNCVGLECNSSYGFILECLSKQSIEEYLKRANLNDKKTQQIFRNFLGFLEKDTFKNLSLDDFQRTELIVRCKNVRYDDLLKCGLQIQDKYLKTLINRLEPRFEMPNELAIEYLYEYKQFKQQYDSLTTDIERKDFLMNIQRNSQIKLNELDEKEKHFYLAHINTMTKYFLDEMENHELKESVINHMPNLVSEELKDINNLCHEMIISFLSSHFELSPKDKENIQMVLTRTCILVGHDDFSKESVKGDHNCLFNVARIRDSEINNIPKVILYLLHEYIHAFSRRDHPIAEKSLSSDLEEGMADVVSEMIFNQYMAKNRDIHIGETEYHYNESDYVEAPSSYSEENNVSRSILYGLEGQGKDYEAIFALMLGEKEHLNKMAFGDRHVGEYIYKSDLAKAMGTMIQERAKMSINGNPAYTKRNTWIPGIIAGKFIDTDDDEEIDDEEGEIAAVSNETTPTTPNTLEKIVKELNKRGKNP